MRPIDSPNSDYGDDDGEERIPLKNFNSPQNIDRRNRDYDDFGSSTPRRRPNPALHSHQALHSQTYGGYGPVSMNDNDADSRDDEKFHGRKYPGRIMSFFSNVTRRFGCSADEMLRGEGEGGSYYRDAFNDESWSCNFGNGEEHGIWMNASDQSGTIMSCLVWFLMSKFLNSFHFHGISCQFAI